MSKVIYVYIKIPKNTQKGLFQPNRLQYGVHSTAGILQREMEKRLSGTLLTIVWMNDILISRKSDQEHLQHLEKVILIQLKYGLKLMKDKGVFF